MSRKKQSFSTIVLKGAVIFNPVLIQLAGICLVAAASTDVITAVLFSIVFSLVTLVNCLLASLLFKKLPRWVRVALYVIIGLAIVCPISYAVELLELPFNSRVQMYMPLLAVNSVTSVHCEQFSVKHSVKESLQDAVAVSIGFGGVMLILGILREVIGTASFAGLSLGLDSQLSGMVMPFGGFIILGYIAMFLKWYINKYCPEFNEQTSMRIKRSKVKLREGEVEEPEETEQIENVTEVEFLFGNEPEEVEVFKEFWMPSDITTVEVVEDIDNMSREHEQYGIDTDKRIEDLFKEMDTTLSFDDFAAVSLDDESETEPHTEPVFDNGEDDEEGDDEE